MRLNQIKHMQEVIDTANKIVLTEFVSSCECSNDKCLECKANGAFLIFLESEKDTGEWTFSSKQSTGNFLKQHKAAFGFIKFENAGNKVKVSKISVKRDEYHSKFIIDMEKETETIKNCFP